MKKYILIILGIIFFAINFAFDYCDARSILIPYSIDLLMGISVAIIGLFFLIVFLVVTNPSKL